MKSELEELMRWFFLSEGITGYVEEFRFHDTRRWRFDFAWPPLLLAVEVEGGIWSGGRHVRGKGFENDCVKYNAAAANGWTVLRYSGTMIKSGAAIEQIGDVLHELLATKDD